jgi:transposase
VSAHHSIFRKDRKSDGVPSRNFALGRSASYRRHSAKAKPKRSASYEAGLYKKHNIIERFFSKRKAVQARRNPLRQTARQLHGIVKLVAIAIWLR